MNRTHPRDSCDEGVEAGGRAHLLRGDDEAAHLLIVSQQNVQMPLDRVEGFGAADVHLCAASVFGHELHEHHDELVDGLVVYARVLRQQISNDGVVLCRRAFTCVFTTCGAFSLLYRRCMIVCPIMHFIFVTLEHKSSLKSLGYICSNSQKYIV